MLSRCVNYIKFLIYYVEDTFKKYNFSVDVFCSWRRLKMCYLKSEVFVELANYILCS